MQPVLPFLSFALDVILVMAAVAAFLIRPRIGGQLAVGMRTLLIGVMILGLAHLIETLLFIVFTVSTEVNEIAHRLLVGVGFIFVISGFAKMRRVFPE